MIESNNNHRKVPKRKMWHSLWPPWPGRALPSSSSISSSFDETFSEPGGSFDVSSSNSMRFCQVGGSSCSHRPSSKSRNSQQCFFGSRSSSTAVRGDFVSKFARIAQFVLFVVLLLFTRETLAQTVASDQLSQIAGVEFTLEVDGTTDTGLGLKLIHSSTAFTDCASASSSEYFTTSGSVTTDGVKVDYEEVYVTTAGSYRICVGTHDMGVHVFFWF